MAFKKVSIPLMGLLKNSLRTISHKTRSETPREFLLKKRSRTCSTMPLFIVFKLKPLPPNLQYFHFQNMSKPNPLKLKDYFKMRLSQFHTKP